MTEAAVVRLDGLPFLLGSSTPPVMALVVAKKFEIISIMVLKGAGLVFLFSSSSAFNPRSEISSLFVIYTDSRVSSALNIS